MGVGRRVAADLRGAGRSVVVFLGVRLIVLTAVVVAAQGAGRAPFRVLTRWDSQWYRGIALHGYGYVRTMPDGRVLSDAVFFPLYPMLERAVARATGTGVLSAGFAVSVLASLGAALGIHAVARRLYGPRVGVATVAAWAVLPVAGVLWMPYSESLFVALAAWSLYAVLAGAPFTAAVLACLAGLTRPTGAAVVVAVMVVLVRDLLRPGHRARRGDRVRMLLGLVVAPAGLLGYLLWVGSRNGGPLAYFRLTDGWGNGLDGGRAFAAWVAGLIERAPHWPGLLVLLGLVLLGVLTWSCIRQRQPLVLLVFTLVLVGMALVTAGFFGSKPRYLLPAFPLLLPPARWVSSRAPATRAVLLVVATCATTAYHVVWMLGPGPP